MTENLFQYPWHLTDNSASFFQAVEGLSLFKLLLPGNCSRKDGFQIAQDLVREHSLIVQVSLGTLCPPQSGISTARYAQPSWHITSVSNPAATSTARTPARLTPASRLSCGAPSALPLANRQPNSRRSSVTRTSDERCFVKRSAGFTSPLNLRISSEPSRTSVAPIDSSCLHGAICEALGTHKCPTMH